MYFDWLLFVIAIESVLRKSVGNLTSLVHLNKQIWVWLAIFDKKRQDGDPWTKSWVPRTLHTYDHLMKIELSIANVTAIGSPIIAENEVFGTISDVVSRSWANSEVRKPLCDLKASSWALKLLLMTI